MCGVSGMVVGPGDESARRFIDACLADHACRGPDHRAALDLTVAGRSLRLGHARLAIVDLSPSAHQPMTGAAGGLAIVYNGEIYNHVELRAELERSGRQFRTHSDTEVILHAYAEWGMAAFGRLNGMFALGLVDRARGTLLLARDRFGIKPLYLQCDGRRLLFSSTAGPIARQVGAGPDLEYVARGLRRRQFEDDSERSPYRGVQSVPPGHLYTVVLGESALAVRREQFYDLAGRVRALVPSVGSLSLTAAAADLRARLDDSVALRLRSDVPVGVSLSGGLDSTVVATLAARRHPGIAGFSFGHPDAPETEGPLVAALERRLGIPVEYVWPDPGEMTGLFFRCLEAQDSPIATGSVVAQFAVYQAARRAGIPVILGGQGGDEILMGYRKFLLGQWRALWRDGRLGRALAETAALSRMVWAERDRWGIYGRALMARRKGYRVSLLRLPPAPPESPTGLGLADQQLADVTRGGLPTLLRYEDRNSMGNSIESRLPFMDYRLVEWAIALPPELKARQGYGKWLLRRALGEEVPREIAWVRYKRGFDVGTDRWVRAGLGRAIREELVRLRPALGELLARDADIGRDFSDRALAKSGTRFGEAAAAIWLGRRLEARPA